MLKELFLSAAILCCSDCKGQHCPDPSYSLVLTLEPGETAMIRTSDGKFSSFFDYRNTRINKESDYQAKRIIDDEGYHIDYHLIIWIQCPNCFSYYDYENGAGACRNQGCRKLS